MIRRKRKKLRWAERAILIAAALEAIGVTVGLATGYLQL